MAATRTGFVILVVAVLLHLYSSPYIAARKLHTAVIARDQNKIAQLVNFPSLRDSFSEQLDDCLTRHVCPVMRSGPEKSVAPAGGVLVSGAQIASLADRLITPQELGCLMSGSPGCAAGRTQRQMAAVRAGFNDIKHAYSATASGARAWQRATYRYASFSSFTITVPARGGRHITFMLKRNGFDWNLTAVILPVQSYSDRHV